MIHTITTYMMVFTQDCFYIKNVLFSFRIKVLTKKLGHPFYKPLSNMEIVYVGFFFFYTSKNVRGYFRRSSVIEQAIYEDTVR